MPNVTFSLDQARIARARLVAARHKTSLSELLRRHIDEIADDEGQSAPPSLGRVVAILRANRERLTKEGVVHAAVFGSVARGEERPGSDVDIAVVLKPDADLFDLAGIAGSLEELLGCHVDVASRSRLWREAADEAVDAF